MTRQVAHEHSLPEDWLNDDVAQFLAERGERRPHPKADLSPGLIVTVPDRRLPASPLNCAPASPPLPGYPGDEADILFLLRKIRPASREDIEAGFARFFPNDVLPARAEDLIDAWLSRRD